MGFWDWLMGTPPQQRELPSGGRAVSPQDRTSVHHLRVGDVVSYDGVDYQVKNKITYEDEGFYWYDYLLFDAATESENWLSVEDDDGLNVGIYQEVDLALNLPPVPRSLSLEGASYRQVEHSSARVVVEREDALRSSQSQVEYWEFEAAGGRYLTVSRWGGEYEVAVGKAIKPHELNIFPAQV